VATATVKKYREIKAFSFISKVEIISSFLAGLSLQHQGPDIKP
jgi:hypothetical protein